MDKIDYKKEYKDIYFPKQKPSIIDIPKIPYIMVDGEGNPNTSEEYKKSIEILYGLSFTIKMSKMKDNKIDGYFEYVVPPLEGLWTTQNEKFDGLNIGNKDNLKWTSMIRQPEFVTKDVFDWAICQMKKKKPDIDFSTTRFEILDEGKCVQIMHIGSYDDEPGSIRKMEEYAINEGYENDISSTRKHHEIYLSDPRKVKVEKLKTVIRHPIKGRN